MDSLDNLFVYTYLEEDGNYVVVLDCKKVNETQLKELQKLYPDKELRLSNDEREKCHL